MKTNYTKSLLIALFIGASSVSYSQIINTIAGNGHAGTGDYTGDGGAAIAATFNFPAGVAIDAAGNMYIADSWNNCVRVINNKGVISTFAGTGVGGFSGDGGDAVNAKLFQPSGIAVDADGNVYIADTYNSRIRMVNKSGVINTIAGNGFNAPGGGAFGGDGAAAINSELNRPTGIAIDASGNIYIADNENFRIRKINNSGIISTVAGNGYRDYAGDGGLAVNAELSAPTSIAVDASGNIYIADRENNRVRMVSESGIISTFAGKGKGKHTGDGGPAAEASLNAPSAIAIDAVGNVYIANYGDNTVRVVNTSGIINDFAGNAMEASETGSFSGDGGTASLAGLSSPTGIAVDAGGNLYIADMGNQTIRKVSMNETGISQIPSSASEVNIYPVPNTGSFTINGLTKGQLVELYNAMGQMVQSTITRQTMANFDISSNTDGIYLVRILNNDGSIAVQTKIVKTE